MLVLGTKPVLRSENNKSSWRIIQTILEERGQASRQVLSTAIYGHAHVDDFVGYAVRKGWLRHKRG